MENIELKSVKELLDKNFFIPDYQRGYRWKEDQVKDLLNDLFDFAQKKKKTQNEFYCLQPLVVRKMTTEEKSQKLKNDVAQKEWYEVIDGQQRLTTIYLLLTYLKETAKSNGYLTDTYDLKYERYVDRDLKEIGKVTSDPTVDDFYMINALNTIKTWFKDQEGKGAPCKITSVLLEQELDKKGDDLAQNVRFIWYETEEKDPISVFKRLNIGKIPLTNAELIKALILNRSNFDLTDEHLHLRQVEIANEWDNIEYTLQNQEFWLFLHDEKYDNPTRIDFIFDIIRKGEKLGNGNSDEEIGTDEHRTFRYFYNYFKQNKENNTEKIDFCWKKVKSIFQTFQEWYNDLEMYHYVGYLIDQNVRKIDELLDKWDGEENAKNEAKTHDKDEFKKYLKDQIKGKLKVRTKEDISNLLETQYKLDGSNKRSALSILLFHNIQIVIDQGNNTKKEYGMPIFYKFPFHIYKTEGWDVEHIDSNTTNDESKKTVQDEWLFSIYELIKNNDVLREKVQNFTASTSSTIKFLELQREIEDELKLQDKSLTPEQKNQIMNYTLLDSSTNRSYGNSIFSTKRRVIIGKDRGVAIVRPEKIEDSWKEIPLASSPFIPPCTKYVFMKYYSPSSPDPNYWTEIDANNYKQNIFNTLAKSLF